MTHRAPHRRTALAAAALSLTTFTALGNASPSAPSDHADRLLAEARARQSLGFEPNRGQATMSASFVARGRDYRVAVLRDGSLEQAFDDGPDRSLMSLVGANRSSPQVTGQALAGTSTYPGISTDPIAAYERVTLRHVYPGIDAVYHGNDGELEYDFEVAPGANIRAIRLRFPTAKQLSIDNAGDLLVTESSGRIIRHSHPAVYQPGDPQIGEIQGRYRLLSSHTVGFTVGPYDHAKAMIIDPTITVTRFFPGNRDNHATAIAVDSAGNSYIAGVTSSTAGFPAGGTTAVNLGTKNCSLVRAAEGHPVDLEFDYCPQSAFIVKLDPAGNIVNTVWFGGTGYTGVSALAVDDYYVYAAGNTNSPAITTAQNQKPYVTYDYGASAGTQQRAYLAKFTTPLTSLGEVITLSASGGVFGKALYVDHESTYLAGMACGTGFPTTPGAFQTSIKGVCDAFVTKLDPMGTLSGQYGPVYSTLLGGSADPNDLPVDTQYGLAEMANAIAVDASGDAWVAGQTCSDDFPVIPGLSHGTPSATLQVCTSFLTEFAPAGNTYLNSMYFGTNYTAPAGWRSDSATSIALDGSGAYVGGWTASTTFYMTRDPGRSALQPVRPPGYPETGYLVYFDASFHMRSSTYIGSNGETQLSSLARDTHGDVYAGGSTATAAGLPGAPNIAVVPAAGFVMKLSPTLDSLGWTQMLGLTVNDLVVRSTAVANTIWTTGFRYTPNTTSPDHGLGLQEAYFVKINDPITYTAPNPPVCRVCIGGLQ